MTSPDDVELLVGEPRGLAHVLVLDARGVGTQVADPAVAGLLAPEHLSRGALILLGGTQQQYYAVLIMCQSHKLRVPMCEESTHCEATCFIYGE